MIRLLLLLGLSIPAIGFVANLEDNGGFNLDYASTAAERPGNASPRTGVDRWAGGRPRERRTTGLQKLKDARDQAYNQFRSTARRYGAYSREAQQALETYRKLDAKYRWAKR